jgi:hypothetical protein
MTTYFDKWWRALDISHMESNRLDTIKELARLAWHNGYETCANAAMPLVSGVWDRAHEAGWDEARDYYAIHDYD